LRRESFPRAVASHLAWDAAVFAVLKAKPRSSATAILLDIFGNPFRSLLPVAPTVLAWNDGDVLRLARSTYDDRQLPSGELGHARLSIFADALTDAGCTDVALLGHLRDTGMHFRGCWAVDAIRGRS
jgi:hypothetical protein